MNSEILTDLLIQYINQQRRYMPITLNSYLKEGRGFSYRYIIIDYNNNRIEIKVYNSDFVIFKVNNHPTGISTDLKQARTAIDTIFAQAHNS